MEISGRENVAIPGPVRPDNGSKWTQRAEKHLLVQYERHFRVPGQVSATAEGVEPMYRKKDVALGNFGTQKCDHCGPCAAR